MDLLRRRRLKLLPSLHWLPMLLFMRLSRTSSGEASEEEWLMLCTRGGDLECCSAGSALKLRLEATAMHAAKRPSLGFCEQQNRHPKCHRDPV